ncbi:MAG: dihydropteroate synthase, partial [Planctomycetes bacterium]|nr:dihydropteroate synthase [Planctomycetota bacterium]
LNVTPDSFSDGGEFLDPDIALSRARQMAAEGADIIDVGAESTRPGSDRVSPDEQIARLRDIMGPVVSCADVLTSIDTTNSDVARFALDAGADIINDISAGRDDPDIFALAAERNVPLVLMHMLAEPKSMQQSPHYDDVVTEVHDFLARRVEAAGQAGIPRRRCIVDPGIGFGKLLEHNVALLANIETLLGLGGPVLVGPSRKRFIGELTGLTEPHRRLGGTVAACVEAFRRGASIFRVHDVAEVASALCVAHAIGQ